MAKIPEKLLKLRKGHNLSQEFIAEKLGIDVFDYMAMENGRNSIDKVTIDKIANLYEITSEELVDDAQDVRVLPLGNKFKEENKKYKKIEFFNNLKHGKYNVHIFVGLVVLIFLVILIITLPKSYRGDLSIVDEPNMVLTANSDTVVSIDNNVVSKGADKVEFTSNSIVKVVSGINYFVGLSDDGKVYTYGLNVKYQKEIDKLNNVVDIASGESHILALLSNGKVKCIGNNDYNQCEVSKWKNVKKIFADGYGSIGVTDDELLVAGKVPGLELINNRDFKQVEFDKNKMFVLYADGSVALEGDNRYNLEGFENIVEIALDDSFVAGLKKDGTVVIGIDNYLLSEKIKHYTNIKTIDAGESYLVMFDGSNVYGIGDNKYNQFEEKNVELKPLASIKNLKIEKTETDVEITFDPVENAQIYKLNVEELDIEARVEENKFILPLVNFEPDTKYIITITAINTFGLYLDSETKHMVFSYTEDEKDNSVTIDKEKDDNKVEIILETSFKVQTLEGMKVEDFISYVTSLGYSKENLIDEKVNDCLNDQTIISVTGLKSGEEITSSDIKTREIKYKYCEVGIN